MTRVMRFDDPNTDPKPARPVREFWTPKATAKPKADAAPKPQRSKADPAAVRELMDAAKRADSKPKRPTRSDAAERQRARQDAAMADVRQAHRTNRRGFYGRA